MRRFCERALLLQRTRKRKRGGREKGKGGGDAASGRPFSKVISPIGRNSSNNREKGGMRGGKKKSRAAVRFFS